MSSSSRNVKSSSSSFSSSFSSSSSSKGADHDMSSFTDRALKGAFPGSLSIRRKEKSFFDDFFGGNGDRRMESRFGKKFESDFDSKFADMRKEMKMRTSSAKSDMSSFGDDFGEFGDFGAGRGAGGAGRLEFDNMRKEMDERINKIRSKMFHLAPSKEKHSLRKLGWDDLDSLIDPDNKLKMNFDVDDFNEESMRVECVNNQITVHGRKKAKYHEKLGDIETDEEWTKTYELPAQVDPKSVTSTFFKDGVMTLEMPAPENPEKHTSTLEMKIGDN